MRDKREKATRQVLEHVARARAALDEFADDGINPEGVLMRPHFQAAALEVARVELGKAIAVMDRTAWKDAARER
jgi:hypothetical protein